MRAGSVGLRREEVYTQLRSDILNCILLPGAELYEGALAERFAVSKSPIRDALSRLEAERLVTVVPRKGYRVAPISLADAADLFQFRRILESTCAQISVDAARDEQLADLDQFRHFQPDLGTESFVEYNRRFHVCLVSLCPNRRIVDTTKGLIEQFDRLVTMSVSAADDRKLDTLLVEHNAIIDAFQGRDGRQASRLLAQHVARAERRVMNALSNAAILP